ncbi:MAG TPA: IPT/TIG domain-containing protein, partial [Planctomycetota bacterium]|nr:IPT/TIG domain-containing protein [Planctomycetota bacterium]
DPDVVPFGGGSTISIQGTDFVDGATVRLFASPLDGSGGQSVAATFVSPTELTLVVPAGPLGETALLVENPDGQVAVAKGALTLAPFLVAGTKLQGSVATPGDVDTALYEAIAGTKLGLTLARLPKSIVQPAIRVVRDSDGTVLLATDPVDPAFDPLFATSKTTSATVKNFVLPQTEILRLEVLGLAGSTGGYKLTIKETLPASARSIKVPTKPPTVVGPGNASFPFVAKTGSTLKGKVTAKKPLQVEVATLDGPAGSILGAVAATLVPGLNNSSVTFKSTPLAKFGAYTLAIGPLAATTGTITGTVTIVAPKATTTFVEP